VIPPPPLSLSLPLLQRTNRLCWMEIEEREKERKREREREREGGGGFAWKGNKFFRFVFLMVPLSGEGRRVEEDR